MGSVPEWVIYAECATCPGQIVRSGFRTDREAALVRREMEMDPPRYRDDTNDPDAC